MNQLIAWLKSLDAETESVDTLKFAVGLLQAAMKGQMEVFNEAPDWMQEKIDDIVARIATKNRMEARRALARLKLEAENDKTVDERRKDRAARIAQLQAQLNPKG